MPRPGPRNLITDVAGLTVGSAQDDCVRSGVTVLLCPEGWSAAVDVRGGGPGVRETETLSPENSFSRAHAICLSGGSVFGLGAADGVASALSVREVGVRLAAGSPAIPIVPGAVLHDLGNGGDKAWGLDPPYRALGIAAVEAASDQFELGAVGAGRGAVAGLVKGGLGSASIDLGGGLVVGALVAANPVGSVYMPDRETFWAWPFEIDGEFGGKVPTGPTSATDPLPDDTKLGAAGRLRAGANTTLAIVAVTADLTTAEAKRVAMMAHDGMGRAVRPAHTTFDGDVVFAVASGAVALGAGPTRPVDITRLGSAAADCLARAIARAVYRARDFTEQ
ncbi:MULTISPECIES: P1 family peptidase [unclassified Caulobacter]|uniref:P1 family peptidase n=1 Tax=unclassified Caulobacter TaxID=2648921 RepID=UPI000D3A1958|nr:MULTISPECIES: P1 family peptidase [unclassified Caulobacter]PTS88275.1 peptidase T4 [Caulobacter sp. HMWF009]PTT12332.1 peptidase T4 [Caulobacter sp. HMWF025]